uniref:Translin-associated factor X-interacting protein 1 N-terminal domain-containing protein n=1 Tax=Nothobranchius furzeri TaxID=105023 RepID=A0A8C6L7B9_NOTFU
MEASPSENTSGTAFVESEVSRSKQDQTKDYSSHAGTIGDATEIDSCPSDVLTNQLKGCSQRESDSLSHPKGSVQFSLSHSNHEGLNNEGRLERKQWVDKEVATKQVVLAERNFAEACEQKLQKELKKLSVQSRPSRDRLAVFSDVFDDVCEGSPVFGHILREIKCSQPLSDSVKDTDVKEMGEKELDNAPKQVCMLEQEARRALEEKKRFQHELQKISAVIGSEDNLKNTSLSMLQDSANIPQLRLQVLKIRKEIQDLEKEIGENLVYDVRTSATERRIKEVKTESMKLIASNNRLRTISKDFEEKINEVLNTEKVNKSLRRYVVRASQYLTRIYVFDLLLLRFGFFVCFNPCRMLWSEIFGDLQTDGE